MNHLEKELYELLNSDPEMFKFLEEGSLDGLWFWNLENQEDEWMSRKFWETLGYDPDTKEHKASEWMDLIHPDDLKVALAEYERCIKSEDKLYNCKSVRYKRPDGSWTYVRCRGKLITDDGGKSIRMLGAHNNITSLSRAIESLEKESEKLKEMNKSLEEFAFIASHDLKEPLRSISFLSQLIRDESGDKLDETNKEYLDILIANSLKLEKMLNGILNYSKSLYSYPEEELGDNITNMELVIADINKSLVRHIKKKGAKIEFDNSQKIKLNLPYDVLFQIILNLVSNAIKYSKPKEAPVVTIKETVDADKYSIHIIDNGIGIPKTMKDPFKLFSRGQHGKDVLGTGIGLAICQKYVSQFNGSIKFEDNGNGTTFIVSFPTNYIKGQ